MGGIKALQKIQLGPETTAGTPVAATGMWRGLGVIEDQRKIEFPKETIGLISGSDRTYIPQYLGALEMESVPATYQQLKYIFASAIENTSPVADASGSGKIWTFVSPTTAQKTIKTFSLEGGDDQEQEFGEYGFVESFKLSGKGGEALMVSASWVMRQVTTLTGGFTALSVPSVEEILFGKGKLFIDAISGTIGTTQVSDSFLTFEEDYKTGRKPAFAGNGYLYFSHLHKADPAVKIDITFEHDTSAQARKVDWRAQTPRLVRAIFEGSALTTAGAYTYYTLAIDFAAKIEKIDKLGEMDGNDVLKVSFVPRYNSTAARFIRHTLVNQEAGL